jgi:hypothetical protein
MVDSLRALLASAIDYAGLFPPAKLPLDEAVRNYVRYREEPERWMLGRFVCPAGRLPELLPLLESRSGSLAPVHITAVGRGASATDFRAALESDLREIKRFASRSSAGATVDAIDLRLPAAPTPAAQGEIDASLATDAVLQEQGFPYLTSFLECAPGPGWRTAAARVIDRIASTARKLSTTSPKILAGFKLRCGGPEPAAVPSAEYVAFAVTACRDAGVPLKFTAGLHHAIRHSVEMTGTPMHGFVNVLGAGVLSQAHRLGPDQVQQILVDEDDEHFSFERDGFSWCGLRATLDQIRTARHQLVLSFGSCNFDEPRDDLRALGLL